jgi:hypothetical protein
LPARTIRLATNKIIDEVNQAQNCKKPVIVIIMPFVDVA